MMAGLTPPDPAWVGRFRGSAPLSEIEVLVGSYLGVTDAEVAAETVRFAATLARILTHLDTHVAPGATPTPFQLSAVIEACAWAHAEWVRIHPFANGNKRAARPCRPQRLNPRRPRARSAPNRLLTTEDTETNPSSNRLPLPPPTQPSVPSVV